MMDLAVIVPLVGLLVAVTNVVVQVLKQATKDRAPTNVVALLVAVALTVGVGVAYCQVKGVALTWYVVAGLVVGGFLVAYAAMFGYDKLKEALDWAGKGKGGGKDG